jgi:oligoendopeptidase F
MNALGRELSRLRAYAGMLADQDTRDARHQGMRQELVQLGASFRAEASYIEPEILRFDRARLRMFLASLVGACGESDPNRTSLVV